MTDDLLTSFRSEVPLPDEATAQRIYVRATTGQRRVPPRRLLLAVATAAVCAALAAVVTTAALEGSRTQPPIKPAIPQAYDPLALSFARSSGAITSIAVTVNAALRDATVQLVILRTQDLSCPGCSGTEQQVVFRGRASRMTNIASPAEGPPGVVALATWTGRLSPSDWKGGCQDGLYSVVVNVSPVQASSVAQGSRAESSWFACSSSG